MFKSGLHRQRDTFTTHARADSKPTLKSIDEDAVLLTLGLRSDAAHQASDLSGERSNNGWEAPQTGRSALEDKGGAYP